MPGTKAPVHRERNFSDIEAHAFIALLRREAGWRETDVVLASWGVKPEREQHLLDEADRLIRDLSSATADHDPDGGMVPASAYSRTGRTT